LHSKAVNKHAAVTTMATIATMLFSTTAIVLSSILTIENAIAQPVIPEGGGLEVFNVHVPDQNLVELEALDAYILANSAGRAVIVTGDFNQLYSKTLVELETLDAKISGDLLILGPP
jgi:hypothetical protein